MAVTFTPAFSMKVSANGGSALLVKGTVTTTANDAVSPSGLGFTQVFGFLGPVVNGADAAYMAQVTAANIADPSAAILLIPIDNADPDFPSTNVWPTNTYDVTFIAL